MWNPAKILLSTQSQLDIRVLLSVLVQVSCSGSEQVCPIISLNIITFTHPYRPAFVNVFSSNPKPAATMRATPSTLQ